MRTDGRHCDTCSCDTAERRERRERERRQREREERDREFIRNHAILTDDDLAWVRSHLP